MKSLLTLLVTIGLLGIAHAAPSDLDFTLTNETDHTFEAVYLSATSDHDWNGNLLPDGHVLAAHGSIVVRFGRNETAPTWDLRVVDDKGLSVTFDDIDLAHKDKVILKTVNGKMTADVE